MMLICLDIEGVLLPELWVEISIETGIFALRKTTRDEPDFDKLMQFRINLLKENNVSCLDLVEIVRGTEPLSGAKGFLDELRSIWPCVLVSDSFYEFLQPISPKLGLPTIFCHNLSVDSNSYLTDWIPRLRNQKSKVVNCFKSLGFTVAAAGDSFNDLGMLDAAHFSFFVNAPSHIRSLNPTRLNVSDLSDLLEALRNIKPI